MSKIELVIRKQPLALRGRNKQSGVVLIIGLIMLLLLTLIGVAGMKDTQLQEKMVGATLDRETAMQAAEAALRQAELEFGSTFPASGAKESTPLGVKFTNAVTGHYLVDISVTNNPTERKNTLNTAYVNEADFWTKHWNWTAKSVAYTGTLGTGGSATVAEPPRYVIEKLDSRLSDIGSYAAGGGGLVENVGLTSTTATTVAVNDYRITARGVGRTPYAVVYLQTTVRLDITR